MPFEDWEGDNKTSITKWIILIAILAVALIGTVYAVYQITSPNSDTVTVTTPAILSKPIVSATTATVGQTITVTTTLSDSLDGVQVFFYENGNQIGSDYTDDTGTATYTRGLNIAGTYTYYAECIHP